jgi:hypothetical protein
MRNDEPSEPTQFGWQSDGINTIYVPSPREIAEQCAAIRAGWTAHETYCRSVAMPKSGISMRIGRPRVEVQVVSARDLGMDDRDLR